MPEGDSQRKSSEHGRKVLEESLNPLAARVSMKEVEKAENSLLKLLEGQFTAVPTNITAFPLCSKASITVSITAFFHSLRSPKRFKNP